jgi:hypothetical protein
MPIWANAVLIGLIVGLIFGMFVARKSNAEKPVQGGRLGKALHYLGASLFVSTAPTVLVAGVVYHYPLLRNLLLAVGMLASSAVVLLLYAAVEINAEKQRGSTANS